MKKLLFILFLTVPFIGFGQCIKNNNSVFSKKFGLGPSLEYIKLNYEYLSDKVSPLLEYIHVYKNNKFDSVYYEWYSNRDEINNINYSVLELKNGLYYVRNSSDYWRYNS